MEALQAVRQPRPAAIAAWACSCETAGSTPALWTPPPPLHTHQRDPPRSVPVASHAEPTATAAAEPPLEPPAESAGSHGLRVTPNSLWGA